MVLCGKQRTSEARRGDRLRRLSLRNSVRPLPSDDPRERLRLRRVGGGRWGVQRAIDCGGDDRRGDAIRAVQHRSPPELLASAIDLPLGGDGVD